MCSVMWAVENFFMDVTDVVLVLCLIGKISNP